VRQRFFDPVTGVFLGERVEDLPSAESLTMGAFGAALVRDTSVFGAASPVLGQRLRFDVSPTFGDLEMTNITADLRQYVMPIRPLTFAGRVLHVGRYGGSGEDQRLMPLFLGYSTLVRGYGAGSFEASECTPTPDGSCPEFDQLIGSRILVFNGEVRAPAVGLFTGDLDYGPVPVELFGFADAGVAWTADERPVFADGPREWIVSVGAGARVNLMGFAIGEFNIVRPIDRPSKGWTFVFNLRPAF
jgi:outer membrane protein assembly factor BamA